MLIGPVVVTDVLCFN